MHDRVNVIKGLEWILQDDRFGFGENWATESEPQSEEEQAGYNIQSAIDLLKEQEAVVRCKDCKYGEKANAVYLCGKSRGFGIAHEPKWFCADAERK